MIEILFLIAFPRRQVVRINTIVSQRIPSYCNNTFSNVLKKYRAIRLAISKEHCWLTRVSYVSIWISLHLISSQGVTFFTLNCKFY